MATTDSYTGIVKPADGADKDVWARPLIDNWNIVIGAFKGTANFNLKLKLGEGEWKVGDTAITASGAEINYLDGVTSGIQGQIDNLSFDLDSAASGSGVTGLTEGDILSRGSSGWQRSPKATSAEVKAGTETEVRSLSPSLIKDAVAAQIQPLEVFVFKETRDKGTSLDIGLNKTEDETRVTGFKVDEWIERDMNLVTPATTDSSPVKIVDGAISISQPGTYLLTGHSTFCPDNHAFKVRCRLLDKTSGSTTDLMGISMLAEGGRDVDRSYLLPLTGIMVVPTGGTAKLMLESVASVSGATAGDLLNVRWGKASGISGKAGSDDKEIYSSITLYKL